MPLRHKKRKESFIMSFVIKKFILLIVGICVLRSRQKHLVNKGTELDWYTYNDPDWLSTHGNWCQIYRIILVLSSFWTETKLSFLKYTWVQPLWLKKKCSPTKVPHLYLKQIFQQQVIKHVLWLLDWAVLYFDSGKRWSKPTVFQHSFSYCYLYFE